MLLDMPCLRAGDDVRERKEDGRPVVAREYVYRTIWQNEHGPVGDRIVHHLCEHPWCIEITHLEILTQGEHLIAHGLAGDWGQADKTHCPANHEYSKENTYTYVTKDGSTERHCRKCRAAAKARYLARCAEKTGF